MNYATETKYMIRERIEKMRRRYVEEVQRIYKTIKNGSFCTIPMHEAVIGYCVFYK